MNQRDGDYEQELQEVLAAFLLARERGEEPNRQDWLARYPHLADDLLDFFRNQDQIASAAGLVQSVVHGQAPLRRRDPGAVNRDAGSLPRVFGNYEILAEIARGGMGVVYRARQIRLNRIVALKMILAGELATRRGQQQFQTEARVVANLDHPHIVPVYEIGDHEGQAFFSMKLIEGCSLKQQVAFYFQRPRDAVRLIARVARAVHHAHRRGVLHRDIKPANILLDVGADPSAERLADALPFVTDFGLAKRVYSDGKASRSEAIVGTASYMAPEQALAQDALTVAADVYSLGAVLYELLTGRPPFVGPSSWDTLLQVVKQPAILPRTLNPEIDTDLEKICLKCLEKDPAQRYTSAEELAIELDHWLSGEPVSVRPQRTRERLLRLCARNPVSSSLLVLVLGLLLAVAVGAGWISLRLANMNTDLQLAQTEAARNEAKARENEAIARTETENARKAFMEAKAAGVKADEAWTRALAALGEEQRARQAETKLLSRELVTNGMDLQHRGDPYGAMVWFSEALRLDQGSPEQEASHRLRLAITQGQCPRLTHLSFFGEKWKHLEWSSEGNRLLAIGPERTIFLRAMPMDTELGKNMQHPGGVNCARFSPDGKRMVTAGADGLARLWDSKTAEPIGVPIRHKQAIYHAAFSQDGKLLVTASADHTARVWDAFTGQPVSKPFVHEHEVKLAAFSPHGKTVATASSGGKQQKSELRWWDISLAKPQLPTVLTLPSLTQLAFGSDGKTLLAIGPYQASVCTSDKSKPIRTIANVRVDRGTCFSPDGKRSILAVGKQAQIFGPDGVTLLASMHHDSPVHLAQWVLQARVAVTAAGDGTVRLWDGTDGRPLTPPLPHRRPVHAAALSGDGRSLATFSDDSILRVWDLPPVSPTTNTIPALAGTVLAISPDATRAVVQSAKTVRLWNIRERKSIGGPLMSEAGSTFAAFSGSGDRFVLVNKQSAAAFDTERGTSVGKFWKPDMEVSRIVLSAEGGRLLALGNGMECKVWDVDHGEVLFRKKFAKGSLSATALSWDGAWLALGMPKGIEIYPLAGKSVPIKWRQNHPTTSLLFRRDGQMLASAADDGTVRIWRFPSGEPVTPPLAHDDPIGGLTFHPKDANLAVLTKNGRIRIWDCTSGLPLGSFIDSPHLASNLMFGSDGQRLIGWNAGGEVCFWNLLPAAGSVDHLSARTRVLSGQQIHAASGSFVPLDPAGLRKMWSDSRGP